ncbi:MAG: bifunctional diguanylate cyclase/phosphodiesterase [Eubacterium sp.]|nr:bifunctional diguanylate cyclase/phosphodiesterase [Eubacterium sp.]
MTDYQKYTEILETFIKKIVDIKDATSPEARAALEEPFEFLGIAHSSVKLYETMLEKKKDKPKEQLPLYNKPDRDDSKAVEITDINDVGNPVVFRYAPHQGVEWDSEDMKHIETLQKLMRIHLSRIRTARQAETYMFRDMEMQMYNLAFYMKTLARLIREGKAMEYNTCRFNMQRLGYINMQIGRKKSSELLRRYVNILQNKLGLDSVVARIGGDNFVCLYKKELQKTVEAHMNGVHMIYDEENGDAMKFSAYAGYYFIQRDCKDPNDIMDNVSMAAAWSKNDRMATQIFFDDDLIKKLNSQKKLETMFPEALDTEEFKVYYQPKIKLDSYQMIGAEALCRWEHDGQIMPPDIFIPILEQTLAICKLDFYMLEHVCRDIKRWIEEGKDPVKVSVNFSRRHLGDYHFLDNIIQIVNMYDIPHEYVEVELTETTKDLDFDSLKTIVTGLRDAGISSSIDDFGIGYSSMNLIRDLPWKVIKIDKSFLPTDNDDKQYTVLKHLIGMATELGLDCIVEGVETDEQVELIKKDGCVLAQGFYFDKPLAVETFEERLINPSLGIENTEE